MNEWQVTTKVVNITTEKAADPTFLKRLQHGEDGLVYIGRAMPRFGLRASPFQNPFRITGEMPRGTTLISYRKHVLAATGLITLLPTLRGKTLACWCHPEPCHGNVLIELCEGHLWDNADSSAPNPACGKLCGLVDGLFVPQRWCAIHDPEERYRDIW